MNFRISFWLLFPSLIAVYNRSDNNIFVKTLLPVNPKEKMVQLCNHRLSTLSRHHATRRRTQYHAKREHEFLEPFQIKREKLMLLNRRLAGSIQSTRDVTIGAMACQTLLEVSGKVNP